MRGIPGGSLELRWSTDNAVFPTDRSVSGLSN